MAKWFHTRIREAREQSGLSQADLAEKLGVTGATISNWENRVSEPRDEQRDRAIVWVERIENGTNRSRAKAVASDLPRNASIDDDASDGGSIAYSPCGRSTSIGHRHA